MGGVIACGIAIPFLGTAFGSFCVFFTRRELKGGVQRALTGFAAGVMVAASFFSLLLPALEASADLGRWAFLPSVAGFSFGMLFLLLLDRVIPHLHMNAEKAEGPHCRAKKTTMMVLAVTLHNIPEGLAVGVVLAGLISGSVEISVGGALALAIGIAIQNFPEGAIISLPLHAEGKNKGSAFLGGVLSGAVEPIGAVPRLYHRAARRVRYRDRRGRRQSLGR